MEPKKGKDKEANGGLSVSGESGANNGADSESKQTRRQFTKNIGGLIFGLTLVDRTASYVFACPPPCNSPGDNDANCNSPGDNDSGCGEYAGGRNEDEGCSASEPDENCHTNGPGGGEGDKDENCTSNNSDADTGCGDCNDGHDEDEHCSKPLGGGVDPDDMCGHVHTVPPMDTDNNCQAASDNDIGCGRHDGPGTPEMTDDDEGCDTPDNDCDKCCDNDTDPDDQCTPGVNTSTPDENCQQGASYDEDGACQEYFDIDEACGHSNTDMDQGCGGEDTSADPIIVSDKDQNCGADFGGGVFDYDERCGLLRTWPLPDWPDNTL